MKHCELADFLLILGKHPLSLLGHRQKNSGNAFVNCQLHRCGEAQTETAIKMQINKDQQGLVVPMVCTRSLVGVEPTKGLRPVAVGPRAPSGVIGVKCESSGDAMEIGAGIMDKEHQPAGNNTNTGVHTHIGILICTSLFSTPLHKICIKYL